MPRQVVAFLEPADINIPVLAKIICQPRGRGGVGEDQAKRNVVASDDAPVSVPVLVELAQALAYLLQDALAAALHLEDEGTVLRDSREQVDVVVLLWVRAEPPQPGVHLVDQL